VLRFGTTAALFIACFAAGCFAQSGPDLGLFLNFDSKPSPEFVSGMQTELSSILAPTDLHLRWLIGEPKQLPGADPRGPWVRAVFIRFHGECSSMPKSATELSAGRGRITLAETEVSDGRVLPYTETDCDRLRAFLGSHSEYSVGAQERLGTAMARVLAHELFHVLLQTTEHSKGGIARAAHTPAALLGQSLRFEGGELERIRRLYSPVQKTSFRAN
jgi:hypothetical protein